MEVVESVGYEGGNVWIRAQGPYEALYVYYNPNLSSTHGQR